MSDPSAPQLFPSPHLTKLPTAGTGPGRHWPSGLTPHDLIAAWPADRPLVALLSPSTPQNATQNPAQDPAQARPDSRWSILASPVGEHHQPVHEPIPHQLTDFSFPLLSNPINPDHPPFQGGWLLALQYELGEAFEPSVRGSRPDGDTPKQPLATFLRCPGALVYDHHHQQWWAVSESPCFESSPKHPLSWLTPTPRQYPPTDTSPPPLSATISPADYARLVTIAKEHINRGDIYQVNLTHHLKGSFTGSSRSLLHALLHRAQPWFGAYFELGTDDSASHGPNIPPTTLLSISPELFLRIDPAGTITTRPMKGTRATSTTTSHLTSAHELESSEKEQAELTMIVDLMRNDLGRLCQSGSIHVSQPRQIESHHAGTILQATAAITGTLRPATTLASILRATFPPGSITGAPKVSAMKIIRQLESAPRGFYCGALGYLSAHGDLALSVAIRTAVIQGTRSPNSCDTFLPGAQASYGVGAGIVADSDPHSEWLETLDKARMMMPHDPLKPQSRASQ